MWPEVDLTLLCRWLSWGQAAKWLRFLNSTCKIDCKSCAACPKNKFLILVTFRDLSWPDLDPDPYLVHMSLMLIFNIFTSPLRLLWSSCEQKISILPTLGFVIRKRQNLTFDLTLTRDLRSILKFKYALCRKILWRAFKRHLAGLDTTIGSRDSRGEVASDPPPRR